MSAFNTNQNTSVIPNYLIPDIHQWEIDEVVSFARSGSTYRFVSMIVGSEPIQEAIKRDLVECDEKGILRLPRPEAPAATESINPKLTIDEQVEQLATSPDPAYRQAAVMYQECLGVSWWDETIKEAEMTNPMMPRGVEHAVTNLIEPIILDPDLKLRQATETKQVFTGDYKAVRRNAEVLSIGGSLTVRMRRHGKNSCWLLIIEAVEDTTDEQVAA